MDTTVPVEPVGWGDHSFRGQRVHNLGLMQEQRNGIVISLTVGGLGLILLVISSIIGRREPAK
jgi:hypothetical protein